MGTLIAFIIGLFSVISIAPLSLEAIAWLPASSGILIGLLTALAITFLFQPLQRNEGRMTPRIIGLFTRDLPLQLLIGCELLYFFLSLWLALLFAHWSDSKALLFVWLLLTGIALDGLVLLYIRFMKLLDPFSVIQLLKSNGIREERYGNDVELCQYFDSLSEVSLRAASSERISLAEESLTALRKVLESYLITRQNKLYCVDKESDHFKKAVYMISYVCDRIEAIARIAAKHHLEMVLHHVISDLGKITLECARADDSLITYPVGYFGQVCKIAEKARMPNVGYKANLILLQIVKNILKEERISKSDLKGPMVAIITELEIIAKEAFRYDKDLLIPVLTQPFQTMREELQESEFADTDPVKETLLDLERVLGDFANLDLILRTVPPLDLSIEEEGTQDQRGE